MSRYTLCRLIHDADGEPTEVRITDLCHLDTLDHHVTDPATLYRVMDNGTGARWMACLDPHTAMVDTIPLGAKTLSPVERARALHLLGCTELRAAQ